MAYIDTKYIYELFENGVAHLHVSDIDTLPRLNAYAWKAEFDNGATIEIKHGIAFTDDEYHARNIVDKLLCKYNDDTIRSLNINKIELPEGFIIA